MAKRIKQILFSTPNRVGVLAKVAGALKQSKVNIQHVAAWSEGGKASFALVTSNNARTRKVLKKIGIRSREDEAIAVGMSNKVGSLERIARRLAKGGVNIQCLTATTAGPRAAVLITTSNNRKASKIV